MTFLNYLLIIAVVVAVSCLLLMLLCLVCILESFIWEIIIPKITKMRYKESCIKVCNRMDMNYYVCIMYNKQKYHFYNKLLYNAVKIGDEFEVPIRKHKNKIFLAIPYRGDNSKYITILSA